MIDKQLIHQAAEDIDIFNADLTEEYERLKDLPRNPKRRTMYWIGTAASIVACFLCAFLISSLYDKENQHLAYKHMTDQRIITNTHHVSVDKKTKEASKPGNALVENSRGKSTRKEHGIVEQQQTTEQPQTDDTSQQNTVYASNTQEEWGMDIYISQLCNEYGVEGQELSCNNENKPAGTVYVFPDDKKENLFSRFQQIACRYDEHKGFRLMYSRQQFYFQLTDENNEGKELWLAERTNNRIYLYRTHSEINSSFQTACYANFKQKTYRTSSINC